MIRYALLALGAFVVVAGLFVALKKPLAERPWLPEYARTATVELSADSITIRNARDWTYGDTVLSDEWIDVTVDPSAVTRAWFIIEPFGAFEGVGHTFLAFEFEDRAPLSFSVQARQEVGEDYSSTKGMLNEYELAYQWGTERDFIGRRLVHLEHELRMYPLAITEDDAERVFRSILEETNALAAEPRFYNTLTANCTNMLAKMVNKHYPDRLSYDLAWNLTGYADRYLMRVGLIEMSGTKEETQAAYDLTPYRSQMSALATSSPALFSAALRDFLPAAKK